jgi:hypothetical protein
MNQIEEQKIEQKFQELEQEIEIEEKLKPVALVDLMNKEFPVTEWLVEHLIPSETVVAVSGAPAAFNS